VEKRARILLIDDDVDFVAATRTILETKPYDIMVAYDGEAGLRTAREKKPDLIILDIIMPGKDGFTVAEQLKKDTQLSRVPVIMLTSFSTKHSGTGIPLSKGFYLENEDYVDKPVSPEDLLKRVAYHLRG
jgi:DNA-binding response OmpR family regulator